jgi:dienelactone hydrolase
MKRETAPVTVLTIVFGMWCAVAAGDEPKPGQVTTVTCKHDSEQTYDCYLPAKYTSSKKWPILYCFSPNANGRGFVTHYKDVCERHGWIVVASNNAKNGPWEPIKAAMDAMWKDTQARFPTNPTRCYSTGWSGGSGVAFNLAVNHPQNFAGVIPIATGTGWEQILPKLPKHVSVYFIMGDKDSADYVKMKARELAERGHKTEVKIFSGGHVWPKKEVVEGAVDWLEKISLKPTAAKQAEALMKLELKDDIEEKLKSAVKKAEKGDFQGALAAANRVTENPKASDKEKEDAEYIKAEITKHLDALFVASDNLLKEGLPYEAKVLLESLKKATGREEKKKAQDKISAITSSKDLKDALKAGKLYDKGLKCEAMGKAEAARKCFRDVVKKYPDTKYAELAKERM